MQLNEIHCQLCSVYGESMSRTMVKRGEIHSPGHGNSFGTIREFFLLTTARGAPITAAHHYCEVLREPSEGQFKIKVLSKKVFLCSIVAEWCDTGTKKCYQDAINVLKFQETM